MRRSDRAGTWSFAFDVIDRCGHGVAALSTRRRGPPTASPSLWCGWGDDLFFHCALEGRKLDLLRRDPRVCITFVAADQPAYLPESNMYTTFFQSAVVTGTAFEVTDPGQKTAALRALCEKMTPGHMEGFEEAVRLQPDVHCRLGHPYGGGHQARRRRGSGKDPGSLKSLGAPMIRSAEAFLTSVGRRCAGRCDRAGPGCSGAWPDAG